MIKYLILLLLTSCCYNNSSNYVYGTCKSTHGYAEEALYIAAGKFCSNLQMIKFDVSDYTAYRCLVSNQESGFQYKGLVKCYKD